DPAAAGAQPGDGPDRGPDRRRRPGAAAGIRAAHDQGAEGHHGSTPPADPRHDPEEHDMKSKVDRVPVTKEHTPRRSSRHKPDRLENEAFRSDPYEPLAGEIRRLVAEGKRRLLITSSGAGEGKSTVAPN